ncbi:MAG: hypothetical protein LH660_06260, partial [Phormidesmis sp. CAN_BIN36]|nr:hypothetical protein [Phormidesmis sp. CAN_BIN36]
MKIEYFAFSDRSSLRDSLKLDPSLSSTDVFHVAETPMIELALQSLMLKMPQPTNTAIMLIGGAEDKV